MWTCSACSYVDNVDARSRCALCDAVKPPQARPHPAPTTMSGAKWSCLSCTLENPGSATTCLACGCARGAAPDLRPTPAPSAHVPTRPTHPATAAPATRPTPTAAPARPSVAPAASSSASEANISFLLSMGFERARAVQALAAKPNSPEDALEWLLAQDAQAAKPKPAAAAPKPTAAPVAATKPAATATKPTPVAAVKPAAVAAAKPTASSSSVKPSSSSSSASSLTAPLKQMSLDEQKAFDQREKKRLELLKLLDQEAEEKQRKAREKAAAAKGGKSSAPTKSASSSSSSSSSSAVVTPASAPKADPSSASADEKKLAQIAAARAAQVERVRLSALRIQKRLEAEQHLTSIDQVCRMLRENYDALRYEAILLMMRRILEKILRDQGKTEKFRRIPLSSGAHAKLDQTLVRPIGPLFLLKKFGGFHEEVVPDADRSQEMREADALLPIGSPVEEQRVLVLAAKDVDLPKLRALDDRLGQMLQLQSSGVPRVFEEILASRQYSLEQVYHLALELRVIVQNIIVSTDETDLLRAQPDDEEEAAAEAAAHPHANDGSSMEDLSVTAVQSARAARRADSTNKNFRTLDKQEVAYVQRIKPIRPGAQQILGELGFQLDPHDLTRQFLVVPYEKLSPTAEGGGVKKYQVILKELNGIVGQLRRETPIALGLRALCAHNRRRPTAKFIELFETALKTVVMEEHNQKYHKLRLDKLQHKVGTKEGDQIRGMREFVALFGFRPYVDEAGQVDQHKVALEYPGFDVTLLKLRLEELQTGWAELLQQAAAEAGGE